MVIGRKNPAERDSVETPEVIRVGGQAVIEGVMMRSPRSMAVAVRKPSGEIVVQRKGLTFLSEKSILARVPLVRGVLTLISALVLGIEALNFSANQALAENEKPSSWWTMTFTFAVALVFGVCLFFLVPLYLTKGLRFAIPLLNSSGLVFNGVDGVIRLMIFLLYMWLISFSKEIRRVFEYHGAEHKSIFAFEAGESLIIDHVKRYSRLHPRCGTSFLLIVMVVSIFVFAVIPHALSFGYKVASRIVLIPLIAGISYELIRFADRKRGIKGVRCLIAPGLWLQRLTAHEPSEDQIEVAIRALEEVLILERTPSQILSPVGRTKIEPPVIGDPRSPSRPQPSDSVSG
jgi:uncharacterized protein YqhQ